MTDYGSAEGMHPGAILETLENEARVRVLGYRLGVSEEETTAEVELQHDLYTVKGQASVFGAVQGPEQLAKACLDALEKLTQGRIALNLSGLRIVATAGVEVLCVVVQESEGRESRRLAGAAFVQGDASRAAIYAVLHAMNRRLGRILLNPPQDYDIG